MFEPKTDARAEAEGNCVKIMACSCSSFAVGRLKKKRKKMEVWLIFVYMTSDVLELACECFLVQNHSVECRATIFFNPICFSGWRKIVACSTLYVLVSTVFGTVSSLYPDYYTRIL